MTVGQPVSRAQVEMRYLNDAEFHMRVDLVVAQLEHETGIRLDPSDRSLATLAAAFAIEMEGR